MPTFSQRRSLALLSHSDSGHFLSGIHRLEIQCESIDYNLGTTEILSTIGNETVNKKMETFHDERLVRKIFWSLVLWGRVEWVLQPNPSAENIDSIGHCQCKTLFYKLDPTSKQYVI